MKILPSLIRYHHSLGPATITFVNCGAFAPTLTSRQPTPSPLLSLIVHFSVDYASPYLLTDLISHILITPPHSPHFPLSTASFSPSITPSLFQVRTSIGHWTAFKAVQWPMDVRTCRTCKFASCCILHIASFTDFTHISCTNIGFYNDLANFLFGIYMYAIN